MYRKDPSTGETVKKDVPPDRRNRRVLTDKELSSLYEVGEKVSEAFERPQDIEWAIADGDLYLLQTRPITTISNREPESEGGIVGRTLAEGLGVSSGTAEGRICLTPIKAVKREKEGDDVILIRKQTSPSDMHGMKSANGILTSQGGTTSHAAIVARELGKPAVVGCNQVVVDLENDRIQIAGKTFEEGDRIRIDGGRGEVLEPPVDTES